MSDNLHFAFNYHCIRRRFPLLYMKIYVYKYYKYELPLGQLPMVKLQRKGRTFYRKLADTPNTRCTVSLP